MLLLKTSAAVFSLLHTDCVTDDIVTSGIAFTVIIEVAIAPDTLYDIVSMPAATPITTPSAVIVAMASLLLLHVPPAVVSVSVILLPVHTAVAPAIGAGPAIAGEGVFT